MADIDWNVHLQPFAEYVANMDSIIRGAADGDLHELLASCDVPNSSNCWWATYEAAQIVKPMVEAEIRIRKYHRDKEQSK